MNFPGTSKFSGRQIIVIVFYNRIFEFAYLWNENSENFNDLIKSKLNFIGEGKGKEVQQIDCFLTTLMYDIVYFSIY